MSKTSKLAVFLFLKYVSVECFVHPYLTVRSVDKQLIEKQRQETFEMCRRFNKENQDLTKENSSQPNQKSVIPVHRSKRDILSQNVGNALNILQETKRVEDIVDKLYDEDLKNGRRVAYRRRQFNAENTSQQQVTPARRYNFAPAVLLGPDGDTGSGGDGHDDDDGRYGFTPWPKKWKDGIVPYFIDPKCYDEKLADVILKAFDNFEKATCIRLQRLRERPRDSKSLETVEWLYITNPAGIQPCVHSNEKLENKGVQMVVFGYKCMKQGEILHEIMHVLGFSHEHTRPDRDKYITVLWDNVKPGYKRFFEARTDDPLMNLPYDLASVMHYPPKAFSKNGQLTILAEAGVNIGQRDGLSATDIEKVGIVFGYECVSRDREYLMQTCPTVANTNHEPPPEVTDSEIESYFEPRLWPYGIINYELRDPIEFSIEERENIKSVLRHIEKETCLEFQDSNQVNGDSDKDQTVVSDGKNKKKLTENIEGPKTTTDIDTEGIKKMAIDFITLEMLNKTNDKSDMSPGNEIYPNESNKKFSYNPKTKLGFPKDPSLGFSFEVNVDFKTDNITLTLIKPTNVAAPLINALKYFLHLFIKQYVPNVYSEIVSAVSKFLGIKKELPKDEELKSRIKYLVQSQLEKQDKKNNFSQQDLKFKILTNNGIETSSPETKTQKLFNKNEKLFFGVQITGLGTLGQKLGVVGTIATGLGVAASVVTKLPRLIGNALNGIIEDVAADVITGISNMDSDNNNDIEIYKAKRRLESRGYFETSSISPARRHANNILTLVRSPNPGCVCPTPGRTNGNQVLEINGDCFNSVNDLLHLFVHVLGLDHQHNMHDRDDYLNILWDNLTPEISAEMKTKLPPAASAGFPYDYQSVMHYPWLEIKDGVTRIMYPVWDDGWDVGHWQGLSITDVSKLNKIYAKQCEERENQATEKFGEREPDDSGLHTGFQNDNL